MIKNKNSIIFMTLIFIVLIFLFIGCEEKESIPDKPAEISGLEFEERVPLQYANQFAIDRYSGGCSAIYAADGSKYLLVPESADIPEKSESQWKIIRTPVSDVYMAATAVMSSFDSIGAGRAIKFSGTKAENWYIEYAKNAMENGEMLYAGKYSEPDYEMLVSKNCPLAVESTMIEHTPEVKEKLEELGITVFIDYSSYEQHPLGRSEWVKVYGEMLGKQSEAENVFNEQANKFETIKNINTEKTVVFFYINQAGQAVTRKSGDYITKMITLAGGKNIFKNLGGEGTSAVTMEMEKFYATAKEADIIIYNSTIDGEVKSTNQLIEKNNLLADFKAVKEGNAWCTKNNFFQETMRTGDFISDLHSVFTETTEKNPPVFLYRLESGGNDELS